MDMDSKSALKSHVALMEELLASGRVGRANSLAEAAASNTRYKQKYKRLRKFMRDVVFVSIRRGWTNMCGFITLMHLCVRRRTQPCVIRCRRLKRSCFLPKRRGDSCSRSCSATRQLQV